MKCHKFYLSTFRLEITTPQLYKQFTAGDFDGQYATVSITSGAYRDILTQAKVLGGNVNPKIVLRDEHGSTIELFTTEKRVKAEYKGACNFVNLPTDYQWYEILSEGNAHCEPADVNAMLKWKSAEKVTLVFAGPTGPIDEPFWRRFYAMKKLHPEMERINYYRRPAKL